MLLKSILLFLVSMSKSKIFAILEYISESIVNKYVHHNLYQLFNIINGPYLLKFNY